MKKIAISILLPISVLAETVDYKDDFIELAEPCSYVSGAYVGVGVAVSKLNNKTDAVKSEIAQPARPDVKFHRKKNFNQLDLSVIAGFGDAFYKQYYAGIELEFFRRGGSEKQDADVSLGVPSTFGLNMDVRCGLQLPDIGGLVYGCAGFSRVLGKIIVYRDGDAQPKTSSFGSFYPTIGVGFEKKINYDWNMRIDLRYAITSYDTPKAIEVDGFKWSHKSKPGRMSIRFSITKNI